MSRDGNEDLEWEEWDPKETSFMQHCVAGSFAGVVEVMKRETRTSPARANPVFTFSHCFFCSTYSCFPWIQ